jgi:hypothetical protein
MYQTLLATEPCIGVRAVQGDMTLTATRSALGNAEEVS